MMNYNYLFLLSFLASHARGRKLLCVVTSLLATVHGVTAAQDYPTRPIRWVLGFAPGGSPDSVARIITPQLTMQLGQSVVLDNRPGANGILAADIVCAD